MRRAAAAPVRALSGETAAARRKVTAMGLLRMKRLGEKICMVTAHDYPSAAHVGRRAARIAHVTRFSEQAKPQRGTWPYTRRRKIAVTRILGRRT